MKTKYLGIIICSIAIIIGSLGVNLNLQTSKVDLFLKNIEALAEIEQGQMANKCCPIWNITYKQGGLWPEISCSTGGTYKSENCTSTTKY